MCLQFARMLFGFLFVSNVVAGTANSTATNLHSGVNPYEIIGERNVFHLNPEPKLEVEPPKPDLPVIKLSGFIGDNGHVRALFASMPKNATDEPTYFNLGEGERDGILELRKIDYEQQEVEIVNSGTPMRLNMQEDGFKANAAATTAPQPAGPFRRQIPVARSLPMQQHRAGLPGS
jgi:hypothetical protein